MSGRRVLIGGARPRSGSTRAFVGILAVVAAMSALVLVRWPVLAVACVAVAVLAWAVWPRWLRHDIDYYAALVLASAVLLGLPREVQVGPYTLNAFLTVGEVLLAVFLLLGDSRNIDAGARPLSWFAAFLAFAFVSFLRVPPSSQGLQNLVVFAGFTLIAFLTAARAATDPSFAGRFDIVFERSFWLLIVLGAMSVVLAGVGGGYLLGAHGTARSFALLALLGVAYGLSRWRYGEPRGLMIALAGVGLIALSLSRAAFVTACVLVPLAWFEPRSARAALRMLFMVIVGVALLWGAVTFIAPLHERFFATTGDLATVSGYTVNANGRTELWGATWQWFQRSPWLGNGAGSSADLVASLYRASQPHNDYLRLLGDYGIVGTGMWFLGVVIVATTLFRSWVAADARGDPRGRYQLWALLGLAALLATMVSDNPLIYPHVQMPLGMIVGLALGVGRFGPGAGGSPASATMLVDPGGSRGT